MVIPLRRPSRTTPGAARVQAVPEFSTKSGLPGACQPVSRSPMITVILTAWILLLLPSLAPLTFEADAAVTSQQLRDEAGLPILFEDLLANPSEYRGRVVVLGGYILEVQNKPEGSIITVIQAPLDWREKPKSRELSQGRFFVTTDRFLDPEVYLKGHRLTVGGSVVGARAQSVGGATFRFPVVEVQELYLWPKGTQWRGPRYPCYDPWYDPWDPWGYPWWGRHPCWRHRN